MTQTATVTPQSMTPETETPETETPSPEAALKALGLEAMLCFALYSAGHAMTRIYKPHLERLGLTYPQFLAMTALWRRDGRLVGELCEELRLSTSTLTPLLKRLEQEGLLTRARDREDARAVRVSLTEKGRALREKTDGLSACILESTGLSWDEARALTHAVSALRQRLDDCADRKEAEET